MATKNRHGLSRHIPAGVAREVRQRSKFGCVICRSGFYQYEHIDPQFEEAKQHDPEKMCCLCGACHDAVSRSQFCKDYVLAAYRELQSQTADEAVPPVGPLDFHDGSAELMIGGLLYSPIVQTLLRHHDQDVIRVVPVAPGESGSISAQWTDDAGDVILELRENQWIGSLDSWDVEVVGPRLKVRRQHRDVALQLRLDPPGRIVVERLDSRIGDCHVLATDRTYAVGRYLTDGTVYSVHANIAIKKSSGAGAVIEFTDPKSLEQRDELLGKTGAELADGNRHVVVNSNAGIMVKPLGIVIASLCGDFELAELAIGNRPLADVRRVLHSQPGELCRFIQAGKHSY